MKVYKIRDIRTGLFQLGGTSLCWSKDGKSWSHIRTLRSHLTHILKVDQWSGKTWGKINQDELSFWEVVEYELKETECQPASIHLKPKKKS